MPARKYRLLVENPDVLPAEDVNSLRARVRAQSNVTIATPGASIDGVSMVAGQEFWTDLQSTGAEDGLYVWNGPATAATRSPKLPAGTACAGLLVSIEEGTDGNKLFLVVNNTGTDVVGTDGLTTAVSSATGSVVVAKAFSFTAPAAAGVSVHAAIASDNEDPATSGITDPVLPRNVQVVFALLWDGGAINIVGTDQFDAAQTETIADVGGTTVQGVKTWKTITSIQNAIVGAGGVTATVQTGPRLRIPAAINGSGFGIAMVDGAADNATFNATYNNVLFASAPNGSKNYVVIVNTATA